MELSIGQLHTLAKCGLDCEQSLFFFRFSEGSVRARERASSGESTH